MSVYDMRALLDAVRGRIDDGQCPGMASENSSKASKEVSELLHLF